MWNKVEKYNYVGEYPDPAAYGADSMSSKKRAELLKWLEDKKSSGLKFNFRKELAHYCHLDVDVLTECAMKFRNLVLRQTQYDPFESSTIASVCSAVFKQNWLKAVH